MRLYCFLKDFSMQTTNTPTVGNLNTQTFSNPFCAVKGVDVVIENNNAILFCNEFINCWDTAALDGVISEAEFIDYYRDVSPSIISDSVFENMVKNTWNL